MKLNKEAFLGTTLSTGARIYSLISAISWICVIYSVFFIISALYRGIDFNKIIFSSPVFYCVVMSMVTHIAKTSISTEQILYESTKQPIEEPSNTNHGESVWEVVNGFSEELVEHVALFAQDGRKLAEQTLFSPTRVSLDREIALQNEGAISIHNHPSFHVNSFAGQDLYTSFVCKYYASIVVTRHLLLIMTDPNCYSRSIEDAKAICGYMDDMMASKYARLLYLFFETLWGWYSVYVSYLAAKRFGLRFQIKPILLEKIKPSFRSI